MSRNLIASIVLCASCAATVVAQDLPVRRKDFGKNWVRSRPFTLMGLVHLSMPRNPRVFYPEMYRRCNLGPVWAFKNRPTLFKALAEAGQQYHYRIQPLEKGPLNDEIKAEFTNIHNTYPGCLGVCVIDEPKWIHMPNVAEGIKWMQENFPDLLAYSNANPIGGDAVKYYGKEPPGGTYTYEQYIDDFVNLTGTEVLCFDVYPFRGDGRTTGAYFINLEIIRKAALKVGIPYWTIVQAFESAPPVFVAWHPSESALRMQVFSSLAYGFTGIIYFCYDTVFERGLLEETAQPNRLYYAAQRVNLEAGNLGQALRFLTSRRVMHIPGSRLEDGKVVGNAPPSGTRAWNPADAAGWSIRNVAVHEKGPVNDAVVGLFEDDDGGRYFMVVNLAHAMGASAADRKVTLSMEFTSPPGTIARLSRETGQPEVLHVSGNTLELTLPGGTGDLFKIGDAAFPGLDTAPAN